MCYCFAGDVYVLRLSIVGRMEGQEVSCSGWLLDNRMTLRGNFGRGTAVNESAMKSERGRR